MTLARRHVAVRHEIAEPFAIAEPLLVEAGNREHVGNVDLLDEGIGTSRKLIKERDAFRINDGFRLVAIDCGRHPTHEKRLQVRILTAQDRVDANEIPLHVERFDVMRDRKQVRFRRQLVSRVSPVTAAKEAQLPTGNQRLDAVLDSLKYVVLDFGHSEIDCASCEVFAGSAFKAKVTSTQSSA